MILGTKEMRRVTIALCAAATIVVGTEVPLNVFCRVKSVDDLSLQVVTRVENRSENDTLSGEITLIPSAGVSMTGNAIVIDALIPGENLDQYSNCIVLEKSDDVSISSALWSSNGEEPKIIPVLVEIDSEGGVK